MIKIKVKYSLCVATPTPTHPSPLPLRFLWVPTMRCIKNKHVRVPQLILIHVVLVSSAFSVFLFFLVLV